MSPPQHCAPRSSQPALFSLSLSANTHSSLSPPHPLSTLPRTNSNSRHSARQPVTLNMSTTAAQQAGRALRWWTRVGDLPEVAVLGSLISGVLVLAGYTVHKTLLNNESGSYPSITLRGNAFKQVETGRAGLADAAAGKHSWLWHVAQYKIDEDGANIGVLFNNRVRPQQYSRPGAGLGGGISLDTL